MLTLITFDAGATHTMSVAARHAGRAAGAMRMLWRTSRPLTATGLLMSGVLAAAAVALWVDPRVITGAPAWLKPAKFAASTAIYGFTLAWLFSLLPEWRRVRAVAGWTTAAVFVIEIGIIDLQAWRGTTSHFNVSTPFDAALFSIMGTAIVAQTVASAAVAVALWRQQFANAALAAAVRAGMIITLLGASSGGLMTVPTRVQMQDARATGFLPVAGAHTVGGPDGGPGIAGTGWSRAHGDLRVGHFVGLHAVQVLPLLAMLALRRRAAAVAARLVRTAAWSYAWLFVLLIVQALRGESIAQPGALSMAAFGTWAAATLAAAWIAARADGWRTSVRRPAAVEA